MLYEFFSVSTFVVIGIISWTSIWITLIEHVSNLVEENKNSFPKAIMFKRNYGSHNYYWNPVA